MSHRVATIKSKFTLVTSIPNKPTKNIEIKECVQLGSIRALANKV